MFASTPALAMGDSVLMYGSTMVDCANTDAQMPSAGIREPHLTWGKTARKELQTLSLYSIHDAMFKLEAMREPLAAHEV